MRQNRPRHLQRTRDFGSMSRIAAYHPDRCAADRLIELLIISLGILPGQPQKGVA